MTAEQSPRGDLTLPDSPNDGGASPERSSETGSPVAVLTPTDTLRGETPPQGAAAGGSGARVSVPGSRNSSAGAASRSSIAQMLKERAQSGQQTSLMVAVRSRPMLVEEQLRGIRKDILRVMDEKMVVVLDPDEEEGKGYLDRQAHRSKERRYTFDVAFGKEATNRDVYEHTAKDLISGVLSGLNGTVFAYGATGRGLHSSTL
jgi:hypothetical protein